MSSSVSVATVACLILINQTKFTMIIITVKLLLGVLVFADVRGRTDYEFNRYYNFITLPFSFNRSVGIPTTHTIQRFNSITSSTLLPKIKFRGVDS